MIKIGIASAFEYPNDNRQVFGKKSLCYIEKDMAAYLSRDNVLPILIPDLHGSGMENFLREMDGLVFQGGTDFAPETYGEKPIGKWKGDKYRDEFELEILDWCIKNEKPVFGICRGVQLLNVYFGGTLYQDLLTLKENAIQHRDAGRYDQLNHPIEFTAGKLLDRLHQNENSNDVNSVHHQAIKELGKDLEILATCPEDGLIEAIQWTGAEEGKVMGVQWHPEFFYNSKTPLIDAEIIYDEFLKHC
ncbi:MAG: peptidase C26 [Flavobacteriales bacterium]|nr:gamma-glutamyl-gamma-aminobutyrate hydrolase family protein [Bacteroidales bacterium AH-315-I05]PCJ79910.1 MAG: peptidase C26 [Flavobacteriales bacterium]